MKSLMALEQVVPVVPQGMFSVMTLKVPLALLPLQKSYTLHYTTGLGLVHLFKGMTETFLTFTRDHLVSNANVFFCMYVYDQYLSKGVFTVSIKHELLFIKGCDVSISIDSACCLALFFGALPSSVLACAAGAFKC